MTLLPRAPMTLILLFVSGCAARPVPVALPAPAPVAPIAQPVALPVGTYPGMPVPAILDDGTYDTPNARLSPAGLVWHLRAGLNFAALACRGPQEAAIIARYNALLGSQKVVLAQAEANVLSEYRARGGDWRDAYDDAMTRLYNYYALAPARAALCATADRLLDEAQVVPAESFAAFAAARLPALDRSFTDVFVAYDAWRGQRAPAVQIASVQLAQSTQRLPWIEVDRAVLRMP